MASACCPQRRRANAASAEHELFSGTHPSRGPERRTGAVHRRAGYRKHVRSRTAEGSEGSGPSSSGPGPGPAGKSRSPEGSGR